MKIGSDYTFGVIPLQFHQDFWRQKTKVCGWREGCLRCDRFRCFGSTQTCDRQTRAERLGHSIHRAGIESHGKRSIMRLHCVLIAQPAV